MAYLDTAYTSGVIAVREKYLLKDKLLRLCEVTAEEAFRLLLDNGFGGGAETTASVYEYEKLLTVHERETDAFIKEYAPSQSEKSYLLSPRDFHNAKALIKANFLGENPEKMLTGAGLIEIETLSACVNGGDFSALADTPYLKTACEKATALLEENPSGAKVGEIFEKALYAHLFSVAKGKRNLKKMLMQKVDMLNILITYRTGDIALAKDKYLSGGTLSPSDLETLLDIEKAKAHFTKTHYAEFVKLCLFAIEKGLPFTQAEKMLDGFETEYFAKRKYELRKSEPFLYYIYRRKAENANVRIVFACLLAGLKEKEIIGRLRAL